MSCWIEISRGTVEHGGDGWALGECLWSPTTDQWGGYRYMFDPKVGDRFIHAYEGVITGTSFVSRECYETYRQPPNPGRWGGHSKYLRVELTSYVEFEGQPPMREFVDRFRQEIMDEIKSSKPRQYPYCIRPGREDRDDTLSTVQGRMIAKLTPNLISKFSAFVESDLASTR